MDVRSTSFRSDSVFPQEPKLELGAGQIRQAVVENLRGDSMSVAITHFRVSSLPCPIWVHTRNTQITLNHQVVTTNVPFSNTSIGLRCRLGEARRSSFSLLQQLERCTVLRRLPEVLFCCLSRAPLLVQEGRRQSRCSRHAAVLLRTRPPSMWLPH